ncbi:MAG: LemA family protein [Flavobacterium sp.]|nr:MAG: LemA family protein [Flavobacterium sp.]
MRKFLPWIIVIGVVLLIVFWVISVKNTALQYNQAVGKQWGDVETSYQRRNDLIGNLVNTVKGAADFEKSTLTAVIEARAKATAVTIDPANITPDQLAQFQQAQSGLSSSLSRLLVSVERYPELKANQNFRDLQAELTSTENQILTSRTRYNEAVQNYNGYVLKMPQNLVLGSYPEKPYFKSVSGAEKPVEVKF